MRKIPFILSVAFTLCLTLCAQTRLVVNTGATASDGTGDSARTAFNKVNTNFATLWAVVYTNGIGATNAFRFATNAFVTSGTNISLNHTITITNKLTIDGDLSHDMELQDIAQLTLDATDAGLYGVASLYLDGGITTLRGVTNLQVITPAVTAGTATVGQVLKLTDAVEGTVEFQSASGGSSVPFPYWAAIASPGGVQNDWEPYTDAFTEPQVGVEITSTAVAITGLLPADAVGSVFWLHNRDTVVQIRFNNTGSVEANRILSSSRTGYTFTEVSESPSDSETLMPGETGVFVFNHNSRWTFVGKTGNAILRVLPAPQEITVNASGITSPYATFARITSASITELRGMNTTLGVGAVMVPWIELRILNDTGGSLTVKHLNGGTTASARISTPTSADVTWTAGTEARFVRDGANNRWRLLNSSF